MKSRALISRRRVDVKRDAEIVLTKRLCREPWWDDCHKMMRWLINHYHPTCAEMISHVFSQREVLVSTSRYFCCCSTLDDVSYNGGGDQVPSCRWTSNGSGDHSCVLWNRDSSGNELEHALRDVAISTSQNELWWRWNTTVSVGVGNRLDDLVTSLSRASSSHDRYCLGLERLLEWSWLVNKLVKLSGIKTAEVTSWSKLMRCHKARTELSQLPLMELGDVTSFYWWNEN